MLSSKTKIFLLFLFLCSPAYALPLPEFASAFIGIGELLFILVAGLTLYFPFIKRRKNKGNILSYLLIPFAFLSGIYIVAPEKFEYVFQYDELSTREDRPGMVWNQEERNNDPNSISEIEAYKLIKQQELSDKKEYLFIDARSRAETELGTALGFTKMSWADLATYHKEETKGKTVIASCWTGMRGSEVCSQLREKGIDCKYLNKGFKGWVEANLPISLAPNVSKDDFGTAETFQNYEKLLSVKETASLKQKGITIVDIRSPHEFLKDGIPGAVNIPFGDITTNELEYQIKILPPNGVVVACYGEVSCSEAGVMGWEINRLGGRYLGAYAGKTKSFIKEYDGLKNPKASLSLIGYIQEKFVNLFSYLAVNFNMPFLVCFISLFLGVLLWFTKELSIVYFTKLKDRKKEEFLIKHKFNLDEFALKRERYFHLNKQIKDTFNSLIPLFLTVIYGFIIQIIYLSWGKEQFGLIPNWREQSSFSFLTIICSIMIATSLTLIILENKVNLQKGFIAVPILVMTIFSLKGLPKISILMIVLSIVVMYVIQSVKLIKEEIKNCLIKKQYKKGFISLENAYKVIPENTKAGRLSYLISKRFKVPNGFVVRAGHIDRIHPEDEKEILNILGEEFAVRSTALHEDMKDSSHAGLNLSVVPSTDKTWKQDMRKVFNSYASKNKNEFILLQKCIKPNFSGAAFSKHPQWGGVVLIEWGRGLSGSRMDGSEVSHQIVVERASGKVVYTSNNNNEMVQHALEIYKLLDELESLYQEELDIEWAIDISGLWLLQARPQSALNNLHYNTSEKDREKLLNYKFEQLNACELSFSMKECSRLSASLICSLWENSSSADLSSRMALWKWNKSINHQNAYVFAFGRIWNSSIPLFNKPNKLSWIASKNQFQGNLEEIIEQSKKILQETNLDIAIDWEKLNEDNWLNLWNKSLANWKQMQVFAFYFELMAPMAIEDALSICNKAGLNGENLISNGSKSFFVDDISYRASNDYEISLPRFIEEGKNLDEEVKSHLFGSLDRKYSDNLPNNIKIKEKVLFARKLIYLREQAKHEALTVFYLIRKAVLNAKSRFGLGQEIFEMEYTEIINLFSNNNDHFKQEIRARLNDKPVLNTLELPNSLDAKLVATIGRFEVNSSLVNAATNTNGKFVSNPSKVEGNLLIIDSNLTLEEIEELLNQRGTNAIVYSKFIPANLVDIARKASVKALCSEYGSVLSHPSVLAREANIPFIIGVSLPKEWKNGDRLTILENGEVVK